MRWEDEGILLSSRNHGEYNAIIEVLTLRNGRHAGLVKYAYSGKRNSLLEPGMQLNLVWTARLNEHLGVFVIETVKSRTSAIIQSKERLLGFNSIVSMLLLAIPEREPCERIYKATINLVELIESDTNWFASYVRWELLLLSDLGFGLDFSVCAVTGDSRDLIYISPKTGRAVSRKAGEKWQKKLISLPSFLTSSSEKNETDLITLQLGMSLTGYFLQKWLLPSIEKRFLPEARTRFFNFFFS